jgi:ankyrin repeat protein
MRLEAVFEAARAGDVEVVRAALSADPAIVDARGKHEARLLHVAAERDDVALAQLLLDYDAEREVEADWGHTPFEWVATLGSERVADPLLDAGAMLIRSKAKDAYGDKAQKYTSGSRWHGFAILLLNSIMFAVVTQMTG